MPHRAGVVRCNRIRNVSRTCASARPHDLRHDTRIACPRVVPSGSETQPGSGSSGFFPGISVHTVRNWEQGRRTPEGPAIALLRIAARHPRILRENLRRDA